MNCNIFQQVLLDYLDGQLSQETVTDIEKHVQDCTVCQNHLQDEKEIRSILKALPIRPMSENFRTRLMSSITEQPVKHSRSSFFAGFSLAVAASMLIWVATFVINNESFSVDSNNTVVTAINEVKHVRLAFQAPADFKDVTLTIELPKHLELEGYSGQTRISWQTSLNSGKNILALPVIVREAKYGEIVATVSNHEKSKKFRVPVNTKIQDSLNELNKSNFS